LIPFGKHNILITDPYLNWQSNPANPATSQICGNPLIGILVGDLSGISTHVVALIVSEINGCSERIGICSFSSPKIKDELGERDLFRWFAKGDGMKIFAGWIREDNIYRTIRLG
jgi:hypothetical protein